MDKKQNRVIIIGLILIILVVSISFFRSRSKEKESSIKPSAGKEVKNYPKITAGELKNKIKNQEEVQILDIRTLDEYKLEHITNSISANYQDLSSSLSPEKNTIIVGNPEEQESQEKAFEYLQERKFKSIFILSGGFTSWKNSGEETVSFGNPNSFVDQSKVTYISPEDLKKIIDNQNYQKFILDVRSSQSFSKEHLPGAINIPLDEIEKNREKIPHGKEIFVYGSNDLEGFQGAVRLFDLNFFSAKVLDGAINDWKEKGFPIEK